MLIRNFGLGLAALGTMLAGSPLAAAPRAMDAAGTVSQDAATPSADRQALQALHADAMAILNALEREPGLAEQLAKDPTAGEALLRARGATRSEQISVTPGADDAGLRTITITIKIRNITIIITIRI